MARKIPRSSEQDSSLFYGKAMDDENAEISGELDALMALADGELDPYSFELERIKLCQASLPVRPVTIQISRATQNALLRFITSRNKNIKNDQQALRNLFHLTIETTDLPFGSCRFVVEAISRQVTGNVLLVESDFREVAKMIKALAPEPFAIFSASSGAEALARFEVAEPWLMVVAQQLPDMSGVDFLKVLEERITDAPSPEVIMVVGGGNDRRFAILKHQPSMYITRGFNPLELVQYVRRLRATVTSPL